MSRICNVSQDGRSRRTLLALMLVLAGVVSLAIGGGEARAASRYTYELCDSEVPGGNPPEASFIVNPGVAFSEFQNCAVPGGMMGITETGHVENSASLLELGILGTPGGFAEKEAMIGKSENFGPGSYFSHIGGNGFPAINNESSQVLFLRSKREFLGAGAGFNIALTCDGNYAPGCEAGPTIGVRDIAVTEVDEVPPTVSSVAGSLLAGGVIRGHSQSLSAVAADEGGGVSRVWVSVNGAVDAEAPPISCALANVTNNSVHGTVAYALSPCPPALPETWTINTEQFPFKNGPNTVAVCASDVATEGIPNTTCSPPKEITVDNSCTESPVVGGSSLSAAFSTNQTNSVTVGFGKGEVVQGSLTSVSGAPVAGATLCVKEAVADEEHTVSNEQTLTTDANGNYQYEVAPGPNRELLIGYRHDAAQIGDSLAYHAHAKPTIEASSRKLRNGQKVHFTGELPGPNNAQRTVILQAGDGGRWLTIRKATTGPRGGYRTGYRFTHTGAATTYEFRVLAPRQSNWAWEPGASHRLKVRVRPRGTHTDHHHKHGHKHRHASTAGRGAKVKAKH
jgi:hypothetical protein